MVTAKDVQQVTFEKTMRGYRSEEVDTFLDQIVEQLESDAKQTAELERQNRELKDKLYLLAQKVEEYRADEDNLKSALINAQRMGENVIREAKQKSDSILREANIRAEGVARAAEDKVSEQKIELERVKLEVAQFKGSVLSLYKQHIESLSTLPEYKKPDEDQPAEEACAEPAAEPAPVQTPAAEPKPAVATGEPVVLRSDDEPKPAAEPEPPQKASYSDSFWEKDESELKPEPQQGTPAPEAFKGIRFSD